LFSNIRDVLRVGLFDKSLFERGLGDLA
jgi:hypothetical protein